MDEGAEWKKAVAEAVGTLALVYVGMMVLTVGAPGNIVAIALAHGLTIAVMVSATMSISGGQLNPAVTVALLAVRKISPAQAGLNIVAQLAGGLLGGFLALQSIPDGAVLGGVPAPGVGVGLGKAILVEAILTFFLMFVIMGTAVDPRLGARIAGLAIGFTVALDILAGGAITGAAMNPARWAGAVVPAAGAYADAAIYFVGPVLGAILAALVYEHTLLDKPRPRPEPAAQIRRES